MEKVVIKKSFTEEEIKEQHRRYADCYEAYKADPTNANYNVMNSQKTGLDYMMRNQAAA